VKKVFWIGWLVVVSIVVVSVLHGSRPTTPVERSTHPSPGLAFTALARMRSAPAKRSVERREEDLGIGAPAGRVADHHRGSSSGSSECLVDAAFTPTRPLERGGDKKSGERPTGTSRPIDITRGECYPSNRGCEPSRPPPDKTASLPQRWASLVKRWPTVLGCASSGPTGAVRQTAYGEGIVCHTLGRPRNTAAPTS
jgi:hypothetical protein